ncbi:MAG: hypothetical protein HZC02_00550 [Candidatus Levybacteria bacterium]|nr:hypothetical protein [Candidatus Levybacteria bacterium]
MINRKIALSSMSIFASLALMGGATFAFFSDSATSTGNSFAAGSFDLKIGTSAPAASDSIGAVFASANMIPGATPETATIFLRNTGTVAGNKAYLKIENVGGIDNNANQPTPMTRQVDITVSLDGTPVLIPDTNGNARQDLEDLQLSGNGLQIGTITDTGVDHTLVVTAGLNSGAGNEYQGDSVTADLRATLTQD